MEQQQQLKHGGPREKSGRKRKRVLTDNQEAYVIANYNRMTITEMSINLKVKRDQVANFMRLYKLERFLKPKESRGIDKVMEGFFNVMERENWAI